ncbi:OsmC family peroxiredoxin [Chitinophaga sp. SYP-B3965]|uniref:OsmC family protein n=1 Tax=Chitinophaga sp. SYP-B3965 TaxID=2663120 RepID=UPI00129969AB|nr:OsmC family protein [Chitinophaga sp. SYP-B3965]MRG45152.1 OsmC family peroxiredoxin [Chitinophaga sp. SYP-B3965]
MQYKLALPVRGVIGTAKYQCTIKWRNGKFIADEPPSSGGEDQGPDPYTLLLSSLVTCTLVTLRMYIDRKGWVIPEIKVNANLFQEKKEEMMHTIIDRDISFPDSVTDAEQKKKLLEIAKNCPISRLLEGQIRVRSFMLK